MHVADIRGWGHLTGQGHGAHKLTTDEGIAIQAANARLVCAAPDMLDTLKLAKAFLKDNLLWSALLTEPDDTLGKRIDAAIAKATSQDM